MEREIKCLVCIKMCPNKAAALTHVARKHSDWKGTDAYKAYFAKHSATKTEIPTPAAPSTEDAEKAGDAEAGKTVDTPVADEAKVTSKEDAEAAPDKEAKANKTAVAPKAESTNKNRRGKTTPVN